MGCAPANSVEGFVLKKNRSITGHGNPDEEYRYSCTISLTLVPGGRLTPRTYHFIPGKESRCPLYRRVGEP
jgi:hypothetical protein